MNRIVFTNHDTYYDIDDIKNQFRQLKRKVEKIKTRIMNKNINLPNKEKKVNHEIKN